MCGLSFIIACCEDIYGPLLIKKKVTMGTSTHNFPLSSLISINSCSFFVVTNNKLDCDLLYWKNFSLVCLRGITFIPSVLKRFLKMAAGIGNEVYL